MPVYFGNNGQLSRDERVQLYGIDCEDQIVWADWTPGNESVNNLVLQNVALVTQKVKFKLPPTKDFDMPYPEAFKLAPGMKKSIPISFRPSKYEPHVDQIQIITKGGSFFVIVKAIVKDINITVTNDIDFGLRPTKEKSEQPIDVYNTGTLAARLKWHTTYPFTVRAPQDTLEVGQMMRCIMQFEPQTASVFECRLVLEAFNPQDSAVDAKFDPDETARLPSSDPAASKRSFVMARGVGKMPHLSVPGSPRPVVEFGSVFPGNRVPQTLEIVNTTPVRACFNVRALSENGEVSPLPPSPFSVTPETGVVEPNCSFTLTFYFQSHTVKEFACQRFVIKTPGGTPLTVTCTAFCRPMEVRLSTRSINFGEVPCGKVYTRTLQLHNDGDRPALYHFVELDHLRGMFWLDRHMGVIPPDSFMVVTAFFAPSLPHNFYKHVHCIVKGATAPLSLSFLGTSHSDKSRPAFLEQSHVDLFRNMQLDGIREHRLPDDDEKGKVGDRQDTMDEDLPELEDGPQEVPVRVLSATHRFLEMMLAPESRLRDITISPSDLDFGSCSTMSVSEKKVVTITNRTSQKVTVAWMIPGDTRLPCTPDEKPLFTIYPTQCDIKPGSQMDFTVSFRPASDGNYEGGMLEAVVFHKINRTFRLVDLKRFTPPWSLSVRGMGHTMGGTRNDPRLDISESSIRFRACSPGQRTYQVAEFRNPGDTCIAYRFQAPIDASGEDSDVKTLRDLKGDMPFRVYPQQGVIEPHQFHLIVLEFAPTVARNEVPFSANFPVVVDYNESHPKYLRVSGRAWEPKVNFCRGQPVVTFPPACSGIVSSTTCEVKNVSEIPISYECRIPSRYRQWFWFPEPTGTLAPSELAESVAHFCPNREDTFSAPMYCLANPIEDPDDVVVGPLRDLQPKLGSSDGAPSYVLQLVGHGKGPSLVLDPENLDLGAVRACDAVKNHVMILNSSQLAVHFTVRCEFVGDDQQAASVAEQALRLGCNEGTVAGRCTETITIDFAPPCRGDFQYCITITPAGGDKYGGHRGIPFYLRADVQYPYVQIADLRTESATLQPQSMMWTQFQVDGINQLYSGEVVESERRFQNAIGIDEKKQLVKQLKPFQLLFGTSAAGSEPTVVYLVLTNPSRLRVRFSFLTPKDMGLESIPYWCDEKALVDDREAHFAWVEEHGVYDIQPRSGEILPGDFLHVKMTYNHHSIGTHILPVVFNVHDGRSLLLYLKAHSVAPQVSCLSVRSSVVQLQPVPLDVERGPVQPVELTNSGGVAAPWRVDLSSIQQHVMDNYDFEVLSVTPVDGILEPNCSTFLHFVFTPLEAKSYCFPVRIEMMKDGRPAEELLFDLKADGYDPDGERPTVPPYFPPNLPIQTYAPVPGCGAALSIEILDFGRCPLRAAASRMLVLVNYTSEFVLRYRWESRNLFRHESEFQIEPSEGELSPGSHCITVFRLFCTNPVDVSGEVACMLEWTHLSSYGQVEEVVQDNAGPRVEYIAYHNQHIHEPMKVGKGHEGRHVSVANRLTVSRFRNLMSTAAGQKFLNENLHRTAVLASHIPSMPPRRPVNTLTQGRGQSGIDFGMIGQGVGESGVFGGQAPPQLPTYYPLYVRIRAEVCDWGVPNEARSDFLILGRSAATAEVDDEQADWNQTRRAKGSGEPEFGESPVAGVLEHILREVMAEGEFGGIVDKMVMEETPFFAQYEDSAPPGEPPAPTLRFPEAADEDVSGADLLQDLLGGGEDVGVGPALGGLPATSSSSAWRSDVLLDFQAAAGLGLSSNGGADLESPEGGGSASSSSRPPGSGALASSSEAMGAPGSCENGGAAGADAEPGEEGPQRYWEEALRDYGEVDLESFKAAAGEVLDKMLLDMMDDVVAGRLNWMRPIPRARPRRSSTVSQRVSVVEP